MFSIVSLSLCEFFACWMPHIRQARYYILTIPERYLDPTELELNDNLSYIKGQLEVGVEGGYRHWQLLAYFRKKVTIAYVKQFFGTHAHVEASRSNAIEKYVWKEETKVAGTEFEIGQKSFRRNSVTDWGQVRHSAQTGEFERIPDEVLVRYYHSIRSLYKDSVRACYRGKQLVNVYYGCTGSGKSFRAFLEAGDLFYLKAPTTKWWDGYRGESNIIIDEFRGQLDISHLLRWLDEYPCVVEVKGGQTPLVSRKWWITSNLHPKDWYPDTDEETRNALLRRLGVLKHFVMPYEESASGDVLDEVAGVWADCSQLNSLTLS
nr:rep protein [Cressdnaviricota sp.]